MACPLPSELDFRFGSECPACGRKAGWDGNLKEGTCIELGMECPHCENRYHEDPASKIRPGQPDVGWATRTIPPGAEDLQTAIRPGQSVSDPSERIARVILPGSTAPHSVLSKLWSTNAQARRTSRGGSSPSIKYKGGPPDYGHKICPISWKPSIWQPIFHGIDDVLIERQFASPMPLRIIYPSVDGSTILEGCGKFPLILFVHGACPSPIQGEDQYLAWTKVLTSLARAGFIVALPQIVSLYKSVPTTLDVLDQLHSIVNWMYFIWGPQYSGVLDQTIGLVGHSNGGVAAASLAADWANYPSFGGQAFLSGNFGQFANSTHYNTGPPDFDDWIPNLKRPTLSLFGSGKSEYGAVGHEDNSVPFGWLTLPLPKTFVHFPKGDHWDYLPMPSPCGDNNLQRCAFQWLFTSELLVKFFSRHLRFDLPVPLTDDPIPPTTADIHNLNEHLFQTQQITKLEKEAHEVYFHDQYMTGMLRFRDRGCAAFSQWTTKDNFKGNTDFGTKAPT